MSGEVREPLTESVLASQLSVCSADPTQVVRILSRLAGL